MRDGGVLRAGGLSSLRARPHPRSIWFCYESSVHAMAVMQAVADDRDEAPIMYKQYNSATLESGQNIRTDYVGTALHKRSCHYQIEGGPLSRWLKRVERLSKEGEYFGFLNVVQISRCDLVSTVWHSTDEWPSLIGHARCTRRTCTTRPRAIPHSTRTMYSPRCR